MSITASSLIALVEARGAKEASAQLLEVGAASDTAGTRMKAMAAGGLLVAGAALVGVGALSVKMAGDFEQSTSTLVTSAGLSRDSIGAVKQGILDLSVSTATSTDQLTKGMFNVQSALHLGAGGLQVLKAAAEGARAENSDLAQTTDVLTTAMVNYHLAAAQAVPTMDSLIVTVADGKMHMDDLTGSLKNVLPVSAAFHIKLSDVEGALATMANAGDRGTAAGTHLAMMFKMLSSPTSGAASEMKAMGINSLKLAETMRQSLPDALKMIQDAVSKHFTPGSVEYNRAIMAILGGSKSGMAGLELFGQGLKALGNNTNDAAAALRKGGKDVENWDVIQGNFNFKMQAAKDAVDAFMVTLGTKLLPVVGQVVSAVTPLITGFTDWIGKSNGLSGAIDQVSSAFQQVFEPVKKVVDAGKPLVDTFDRATSIFAKTNTEAKPLFDTFDRGRSILTTTHAVAMPLFDTFDRATTLLPKTTDVIKKTTEAVSPLVAIFKYWKPVLEDVVTDVKVLTVDAITFASGIISAAEKSGLFQSVLQFLHDELPAVGTFLVNVGGDINTNLLPPLESLITNVGSVAAGFITWADKSGYAKATLDTLGGAIQLTTQILGPLVQAVSDVVGWLGGGGAGTDTLVFTLSAAATAFTLLKIADTTAQFGSFISKLQEGDGIISNLASSVKDKLARAFDDFMSNQAPHLKASMDSVKVSAQEAAVAEEEVAAAPVDESAAGWFARLETSLGEVETTAASTGVAVGEIGTTAETTMAEGVATGSTESETSLAGVGVAADETKAKVASAGTTGGGAMSAMGGIIGGLVIGIAAMGNEFAFSAVKGKDFVSQFQQGDWLGSIEHFIALGTPGGQLASTIDVFTQIGQKMGLVKNDAQDMDKKTSAAAAEMQRNVVASGNDMANKMLASMELMRGNGVTDATKFSDSVMRVFNEMKTSGINSLSDLDASAKSYLQEIQNYVDAMNGQLNLASNNIAGRNTKTSMIGKQGYASGTDYVPQTGTYMVGERGPERVVLQQGSRVIPNDQIGRGGSGWGGSSNSQPMQINLNVDGQTFASLMVDHMGNAVARDTRLRYGRRAW